MAKRVSCWTIFLILVIFCPLLGSATYNFYSRRLRLKMKYRQRAWIRWRSSGLFMSRNQLRHMQSNRNLNDLYVVESTVVAFPFEGACSAPLPSADSSVLKTMPECDEDTTPQRTQNGTGQYCNSSSQGCCKTVMRVEFPQVVTSIVTLLRHQVLQFASSSQLVHTGQCEIEGGGCVLGGTCTTFYRIQWLLVRGTPIPTTTGTNDDDDDDSADQDDGGNTVNVVNPNSDFFVPTMVPNHCQCVFS